MLPKFNDINIYDSLDERRACEHFLGKTLDDAEAMFRANWEWYQEDLMWMGPRAFRYYVTAAIRYLQSAASVGTQASYFTAILDFKILSERLELKPIAAELAEACRYIVENLSKFTSDLPLRLEDDLRASSSRLVEQLEQLACEQ
jgi:hypothetical protein